MSLRLRNVQLDVPADGFDDVVTFWAGALGADATGDGAFAHLAGAAAPVGVHVQRQHDGPARVHLDLEADDVDAEVARLVALGAVHRASGEDWEVLADPAGLLLCVSPWGAVTEDVRPRPPGGSSLDIVVVDVPSSCRRAAADFWSAALGSEARPIPPPNDAYAVLRGLEGPGGPYRLLLQEIGEDTPRFHLDLHTDDHAGRDAEVERLTALGGRIIADRGQWVTLADPAGNLLCVVSEQRGEAAT